MNASTLARRSVLMLAAALLGADARAASPDFRSIRPVGGRRGTEVAVDLTGKRLGDAREILFYQPGVSVADLKVVDDTHIKATFKVAADATLGLRDLRVRTATGVSEIRTFSVGALPEATEAEPNDDFARPQVIPFGSVVNGVAQNEDVDYYAFDARKGDRITAEVEGARLGIALFDPYVAILDGRRFELASSDDAALIWQDAFAQVIAATDGRYYVQVRESAYAGTAACLYRLHVGDFPRPSALIPSGGKLGDTVDVRLVGDVLGDQSIRLALPENPSREFGVLARDTRGEAPQPNTFKLSPFGNVVGAEPDDDHDHATRFEAPLALNGVIDRPDDVDHYVFAARKGQTYQIRVFARRLRSPLDAVLSVAKKGAGPSASNDDANNSPDSSIKFTVPDDGDYVIAIRDHLRKGGPSYFYRVEVGSAVPMIALSVPEESIPRGAPTVAVAVPRGNRQAILVNARRVEAGGAIHVEALGLPEGVSADAGAMAANQPTLPVLFEAKGDAPLAAALVRVEGRPLDPKLKIPSEFRQTTEFTLGQNNVPYWSRSVDHLAVAVTEEAPFSIEVVEPRVPLVRGGSMMLKVRATRKPGFDAAIAVSLPWNPPGIGSSGGVAIAEKATEAEIPINADGGAALATWRVVVNGTAGTASGPLMVSSQLAKLTVADRFLNFTYQPASVEQGKETDLVVAVARAVDFEGEATATLIGLPNKATTEPRKFTKDAKELVFRIRTDAASPAGNHQNLFCQVAVPKDGEAILHNLGSGQLRIDAPLPAKPRAAPVAAAAPAPTPAPAPEAPKAEKRLSRLEKLRAEALERARGASAEAATAPKNP